MTQRFLLIFGSSLFFSSPAIAQDAKPVKITAVIRGVVGEPDAKAVRQSLKKVAGITFNAGEILPGEKGQFGHYFSPPFIIKIADLNKTDVGAIAKAVAESKTPSRKEIKPSLNLILYHPAGQIEEGDVASLRQALTDVNGVEAQATGGIGGVLAKGRLWVRLEAAGGANLNDIRAALQKAGSRLKLERE